MKSKYPGLGIGILLATLFVVLTLDLEHMVAIGYGGVFALAHVSRSQWRC
jgi:hypothetical protein